MMQETGLPGLFKYFPQYTPFIGERFSFSGKRVLTVEFAAPAYGEYENVFYVNKSFSSKRERVGDEKNNGLNSIPQNVILGASPSGVRLRERIRVHLPDVGVDEVAFYYFLPFPVEKGVTKIDQNDRKIATELFMKVVNILRPLQVVFFGNMILNDEIVKFLEKEGISYKAVSLRADFEGRNYNAQDPLSQKNNHGLQKLVQISDLVKGKIDLIPEEIRGAIQDLLNEIDFMDEEASKAKEFNDQQSKKIQKYVFVRRVARELNSIDRTMYMKDLALLLNANDFRTALGDLFDPHSRGVYKLVAATTGYLVGKKDYNAANNVMERFVHNKNADITNTVSAALMSVALERKYGYKSIGLNIEYSQLQEERKRVFGDKIPSEYMPINEIFKSGFGAPPCV